MTVKRTPISAVQLRHARLWLAGVQLLDALLVDFFRLFGEAAHGFDVDAVHDLRVASRRLREGLALFAPVLPAGRARRLSRRVRELTRLLGELRNADEGALFMTKLEQQATPAARREARRLQEELTADGERMRGTLEKELKGFHAAALRNGFERMLARSTPFKRRRTDPFRPFPPFAASAFAERGRQVATFLPAALNEEDGPAQHRLRVAVKKLRYRLEIVAPLSPDLAEEVRQTLKRYQDLLGELHDLDVFTGLVRERVAGETGGEELLDIIRQRRAGLFAAFAELAAEQPPGAVTARVTEELAGLQDLRGR